MINRIILLFVIWIVTAAKSAIGDQISGRIYEGNLAPSAAIFPFAVHIYTFFPGSGRYGAGTIISSNSILCTASQLEFGTAYEVGYGSHIRMQQTIQFLYPQHTIYHPQYNSNLLTHNLAIIRLPRDIMFNQNVQPVQLPGKSYAITNHFVGLTGTIIGWGEFDANLFSNNLRYIEVFGITNAVCANIFSESEIIASSMCTRGYLHIRHNACMGDIGGPLLQQHSNSWTLMGVIAHGAACPTEIPTRYINVAFYLSWISHITGIIVPN